MSATDAAALSPEDLRALYRGMLRVRRFEERCVELYTKESIRGFLHVYIGEEAVAAGVMHGLAEDDAVVATYREHGHALLKGIGMNEVMAEMFGKALGTSRGRGGSMHIFDVERRFYGGNAIVAGSLPMAVGLALADKFLGCNRVSVCFFGDGAAAEGLFHECLNLAALWQLPVLFVCENNFYAMGTALGTSHAQTELFRKSDALGVPAERVDGMDVLAVEEASRRALSAIRGGEGPRMLECMTYRFRAHSMFDPQLYRRREEVEEWKLRDPIPALARKLVDDGLMAQADLDSMDSEVVAEVDESVRFAEAAPWEPESELLTHVMADAPAQIPPPPNAEKEPETLSFREAFRRGLIEALEHDPRVFLMGEDVGRYGGCYAVSHDLFARFGPERIRDTPLAENGFTGAGIGAALGGARPIVEIMTVNFSLLAMDQIVNTAATLLHMSGGQLEVPIVIRMPTGAGRQVGAQHSHSFENWYAHVPGIKVLAPGTLEDARHMLWAALHDPNPVIIFEHVMLYNREGELEPRGQGVDIERAAIRRRGRDVSLITYGGCLHKTMEAAERLAGEGIDAEVVDLRVLRPLDTKTLLESVGRTRRAVVVDEGYRTGSLAGEILAILAEEAFWDLDAPLARVCTKEVPIPYPQHLEMAALPQVEDIVRAAGETVRGAP
jgi:2-oxoisovalerate dehydrogenase E1 component